MTSDKPFALSVKVVITDGNDRCLVLRRAENSGFNSGKWDFPGGKLDPGEDFNTGLIREITEETGLNVYVHRVVGAAESESPKARIAYIIIEAKVGPGQVVLSAEHDKYAWVSRQDLPGIDLCRQFHSFAQAYAADGKV